MIATCKMYSTCICSFYRHMLHTFLTIFVTLCHFFLLSLPAAHLYLPAFCIHKRTKESFRPHSRPLYISCLSSTWPATYSAIEIRMIESINSLTLAGSLISNNPTHMQPSVDEVLDCFILYYKVLRSIHMHVRCYVSLQFNTSAGDILHMFSSS